MAALLAGGTSVAALVELTSVATGSLVAAASHRPGALDDWRLAGPSRWAAPGAPTVAKREIVAENPEPERRDAPRADDIQTALMFDETPAAWLANEAQANGVVFVDDEGLLSASVAETGEGAPAFTTRPPVWTVAFVASPRVISPAEPVQMAAIPEPQPIRLASLETGPSTVSPLVVDPATAAAAAADDEPLRATPFPTPRPLDVARMARDREPAAASIPLPVLRPAPPTAAAAPRPVALAYAAPEIDDKPEGPADFLRSLLGKGETATMPRRGSGIAVYDIASATVRLPSGERLEAHSGLGHRQDNPAYVREKNRGPTPPNVYSLRMREALFHGTEAIRLTPRDQKRVFNRDGLLAHPYMYVGGGGRSQSNGCVVFKDYGRFLRAFKAGEIAKLVVVPNIAELPTAMAGL